MDLIFTYLAHVLPAGYAEQLETTGWYALGIPLIALVLYLEIRWRPDSVGFAEPLSNLSAGLSTLLVGLFVGPVVVRLYEFGYSFAPIHWGDSPWRWPVALVLSDLCYYLHHRAGHSLAILWAVHGIHHQHERLNSTVGLRLEWLADISTIVFFAPMPLFGFDLGTGFFAIAVLSLYALTTHCVLLSRPTLWLFATPATHGAHHSRDARYAQANFSAMFTIWDRVFGTYKPVPPGDVLHADFPTICREYDGISAQWGLLGEMIAEMRRAPSIGAALRIPFSAPSVPETPPSIPRPESTIEMPLRRFLFVDFVTITMFCTWLLWRRGAGTTFSTALAVFVAIFSLRANGRLLDGRPDARRTQWLRLVGVVVLAWVLMPAHTTVSIMLLVGTVFIAGWMLVSRIALQG